MNGWFLILEAQFYFYLTIIAPAETKFPRYQLKLLLNLHLKFYSQTYDDLKNPTILSTDEKTKSEILNKVMKTTAIVRCSSVYKECYR